MPVNAEMDAREGKFRVLDFAVLFVRIARGHEEGFVNFKTPRAALDGAISGKTGEPAAWGLELDGYRRAWKGETYRSIDNCIFE